MSIAGIGEKGNPKVGLCFSLDHRSHFRKVVQGSQPEVTKRMPAIDITSYQFGLSQQE
jgi:hypothetical protein